MNDLFGASGESGPSAGTSFGRDLRILDGVASWCGALHGSMPLNDALQSVAEAFGADAALISRDARSDGQLRVVAEFDAANDDIDVAHLKRSFAPDVLGPYYNKMRGGSSWFLSDHQGDPGTVTTQILSNWQLSRGISDIVVVALESSGLQHDYVEFHFGYELQRSQRIELEGVFVTLVRAWAGRKTGLVTRAQMDERIVRARAAAEKSRIKPDAPILGVSNPARLSRAEFRVCLLLSRGLSVKGVTLELGLSEATIRSHLRSIYSKTETSGMAELVYRLLSNSSDGTEISRALR